MKLRPYQEKAIEDVVKTWNEYRKVCLVMPTAAGKSKTAIEFARQAGSSIMIVHRKELLDQAIEDYELAGLDVGVVAAERGANPTKPHQVAMVQTLARRQGFFKKWNPGVIIVDEMHLSIAKSYDTVFEHFPNSKILGLTATPIRLDGYGLCRRVDKLVKGPSVKQLIEQGYIADYDAYAAPEEFNLKGVKKQMGDYQVGALGEAVDNATYTGNAVKEYQKHLNGKQAIVFSATVDHGYNVAKAFNEAGIPAAMLDGTTSPEERATIISSYKRSEILVLVNVQLFIEGFNVPACNGVIMLRPTQSLARYLQMVGRGFRLKPDGSKLIVLDHAGNIARHGFPDEDRDWALEDKPKSKGEERAMPVKNCPNCFRVQKSINRRCVECQYEFVIKTPEIKEAKGNLVKLEKKPVVKYTKWSASFWNAIQSVVQGPGHFGIKLKKLQTIAEGAGFKRGWGYMAAQAFITNKQPVPKEGYVPLRI